MKAFGRELRRTGQHDYYSGKSHLMRLAGLFRPGMRNQIEAFTHLWLEPAIVLAAAVILGASGVSKLPSWLVLLALSLWSKEAINFWFRLRHQKKQSDVFHDAEEGLDHHPGHQPAAAPTGAGRRPRQKRPRVGTEQAGEEARMADRYAEILRLLPPYTLEQAEANYRTLTRACHPDTAGAKGDVSSRMADLKEALEYFRRRTTGDD